MVNTRVSIADTVLDFMRSARDGLLWGLNLQHEAITSSNSEEQSMFCSTGSVTSFAGSNRGFLCATTSNVRHPRAQTSAVGAFATPLKSSGAVYIELECVGGSNIHAKTVKSKPDDAHELVIIKIASG